MHGPSVDSMRYVNYMAEAAHQLATFETKNITIEDLRDKVLTLVLKHIRQKLIEDGEVE